MRKKFARVKVQSPSSALEGLLVGCHAYVSRSSPNGQAALDAMRKEYAGLEAEPVDETIAGHNLIGFDLNFFYLDLTNTAAIRSLRVEGTTYTIFFQAEDGEYREIGLVFAAMTVSLLRSIGEKP